uniref:Uncharacterized protein n=1 Tax=Oryza brachyantha TaxID=4533 RepID=J3M4M9_ORYBR
MHFGRKVPTLVSSATTGAGAGTGSSASEKLQSYLSIFIQWLVYFLALSLVSSSLCYLSISTY